ncbi:MAG: glycosyltransferase [Proteobacteria bacterium]|nr:glycosyltransferase [Pseudomonadota bacterium]
MRVLLVGPTSLDGVGGNVSTIARLRDALRGAGVDIVYRAAEEALAVDGAFDVVHAFHALRAAPRAAEVAAGVGAPLVITLTGTDLRPPHRTGLGIGASVRDAEDEDCAFRAILDRASAVVVFDDAMREEAEARGGRRALEVIAQGCDPPRLGDGGEGRAVLGVESDSLVFVMVAGLRPVKQPHVILPWLARVRQRAPRLVYRVIGPRLDARYAVHLGDLFASAGGWARLVDPVPHARMSAVYAAADVVVNASLVEGMSGALVEAMSHGRAVLASDIPANRSLVDHGVDGLLFDGEEAFVTAVCDLLDARARERLGEAARRRPRTSVAEERDRHLALYRRVKATGGR